MDLGQCRSESGQVTFIILSKPVYLYTRKKQQLNDSCTRDAALTGSREFGLTLYA